MIRAVAAAALLAAAPALADDASPAAEPVPDAEVGAVLSAVAREASVSDRLAAIDAVARRSWFTVAQVGTILDALAERGEKLWALALLRRHIVDRANQGELYPHFFHRADQLAAGKLLAASGPPELIADATPAR